MLFLSLLSICTGFYLPGVSPEDFRKDAELKIFADKLDSPKTQIPYEYFYLKFCRPSEISTPRENIGQELVGDVLESTSYLLRMNSDESCKLLCTITDLSDDDIDNFRWMIDNEYRASWELDSLPAGIHKAFPEQKKRTFIYQDGFPLGFQQAGTYYVNNHHNILVQVHSSGGQDKEETWRVVGFLVEPLSLNSTADALMCNDTAYTSKTTLSGMVTVETAYNDTWVSTFVPGIPKQKLEGNITFSYSVRFEQSNTTWATRWEHYFYMSARNQEVHWLGLVNSFAMVLLLSGMVCTILRRSIHKDITHYNDSVEYDDETGWKQVRSDVFRSPSQCGFFSIIIGTGVQVISMVSLILFFTSLGFLSPEHRGGLLTTMLVLFVFMGIFAGYSSGRLFKMFGGAAWKANAFGTAVVFPGLCFGVFFFINFFLIGEESSGAVSFTLLLQIVMLWFGISVPLVFLGAFVGYSKPAIQNPSRVSKIPKPIQITPGYQKIKLVSFLAGCLPFGSMFIELSYVMHSLWHPNLSYYLFGFLFLCFIVLVVTSAEVSVLMCYILLCREDYRWWWLSFMVAGSSGVYFFGYAVVYWMLYLEVFRVSSMVLYFGYMLLGAVVFSLITGTIGFFATFTFIRTIFSLIKIE
jgi:transmembrane 9 superfamily member 2/4